MPNANQHREFAVFCGIIIFVIGASAGFFFSDAISGEKVEIPELDPQVKVVTKIEHQEALPADTSELQSLRARIAELEEQLAERENESRGGRGRGRRGEWDGMERPRQQVGEENGPRQPRQSWQERMEKLKEENPELFAEMERRAAEWRERRKSESQTRREFFNSIDTSRMTPEQKENHAALINAFAVIDAFQDKAEPGSGQSPTQEEAQEFFEAQRLSRTLMDSERQYILSELGKDCGLDGNEFAEFIETVYTQTGRGGWPRNRGPQPPPPPRDQ